MEGDLKYTPIFGKGSRRRARKDTLNPVDASVGGGGKGIGQENSTATKQCFTPLRAGELKRTNGRGVFRVMVC